KKDVLVQVWRSNRDVRIISTIHSAEMQESRNTDSDTKKNNIKPVGVLEYNKYMKGVDRADQYISHFKILRKTKKWTNRVFMYLINCALFNS
ncbi:transposase, partial [Klebsiella pneumoniae]|nr:transposase [Klebsiella pneumoniae]